jgi:hypothetical protein
MALDKSISHADSLKEAMHLSAAALVNQKISLVSVWSPTFLLELIEILFNDQDLLVPKLNSRAQSILLNHNKISSEFCQEMWPDLHIISAWDTSTSKGYALKIKELFPQSKFQGKGLWATEGVVSIPFAGNFLLAYQSHFYEFECVGTKKVYPAWKCEKGLIATVLLTTAAGLTRYRLSDRIKVVDFHQGVPCIEFLGRENVIDLVGEKLSTEVLQKIINRVNKSFPPVNAISFLAHADGHPYYELLIEGNSFLSDNILEGFVESLLLEHFHYRLARETMQLQKIIIRYENNAKEFYFKLAAMEIKIKGNIKIESALIIRNNIL